MAPRTAERRVVTVLFADIAGSTAIAEQLGPERSKFLVDEVVRLMSDEVRDYDGTVAQLTGDGLLALFGAPVAHEDDAERAVRAALGLQCAIVRYAEEVESAYGIRLTTRVGVNTGPVVVSSEEEDGRERYNALGDTVNVAARLQAEAEDGGILLGPDTARLVEGCFELKPLGDLALRGKQDVVPAFGVAGEQAQAPAPEHPLVGREFELVVLERTFDGLVEGRGVIAAVIGEAGIGKSRLAAEVCQRYHGRIRFLEGRAVSYAQTIPFWPVRDMLRSWLGLGRRAPEARIRLELKAQLARLFGDESPELYPFLGAILGVTLEPEAANRMREFNRESVQRQSFAAVYDLLVRLAEEQPLCLVFEDLHWADESTLELLESLLAVTEEAAVGLLLLHRSEREHRSWRIGERARQRYPHRYKEIELRPLPADASREIATNVAGAELPLSVAELLADRAGGNPFFLEAALRDLVERGALRLRDGRFELAVGEERLAIPAAVQGALQARLDRLAGAAREVVSLAAVMGRSFDLGLIRRILPRDQLVPALSELQRLDLIVEERRRPSPEFRFRHGLVQEVAYASLLDSKRRKLHASVAHALEELHAGAVDVPYAVLARHFAEADEPAKAAEYLLLAGDAARGLYAEQEALEHYRRARGFLARLGDDRRTRETLFKIALVHHLAFDFAGAEEAYDEAFCCRVEEDEQSEPTESLDIVYSRPGELVPGDVYTTDAMSLTENLFRGLLRVDRDLNVLPSMAENFRVSSDGLTYLFQLRENAR